MLLTRGSDFYTTKVAPPKDPVLVEGSATKYQLAVEKYVTYTFQVVAINAGGESPVSNKVTFRLTPRMYYIFSCWGFNFFNLKFYSTFQCLVKNDTD